MKSIFSISAIICIISLVNCSEKEKVFGDYDINPLKKSLIKNNVSAYSIYSRNYKGKLVILDSLEFDARGNPIIHHLYKTFYKYDSLGHLTSKEYIREGIKHFYEYQSIPNARILIIKERYIDDDTTFFKYILEYDETLTRVMKGVKLMIPEDDTVSLTSFHYDEKGEIQKSTEYQKIDDIETISIYTDSLLSVDVKFGNTSVKTLTYYSETGLIDSVKNISSKTTFTHYYKYYYR